MREFACDHYCSRPVLADLIHSRCPFAITVRISTRRVSPNDGTRPVTHPETLAADRECLHGSVARQAGREVHGTGRGQTHWYRDEPAC